MSKPLSKTTKAKSVKLPTLKTNSIIVKGAKVNNLKNIDVEIPRNKLTVVTGLSGSGKSSLAFETIYAEGQRRFVESLSSYVRQFLERMQKPDVDSIIGLPPAIAIKQLPPSKNPRSTVGTTTEIYDYLSILYGRLGNTICYKCGTQVTRDNPSTILQNVLNKFDSSRVYILFKMADTIKNTTEEIEQLKLQGFFRLFLTETNEIIDLTEVKLKKKLKPQEFFVIVDRAIVKASESTRLSDSIDTAFKLGNGILYIYDLGKNEFKRYSNNYECNTCEIIYEEPDPKIFSFNNPKGACPNCQGFGRTIGIDEELVIPDKGLTINRGAIQVFNTPSGQTNLRSLLRIAQKYGIRLDVPYRELSNNELEIIWDGKDNYEGINGFFAELEDKKYKVQNRVMLARYRGYTTCRSCNGSRIRTSARQVFYAGKNVPELLSTSFERLLQFFDTITLNDYETQIAGLVLKEIKWRIGLLVNIGLEYLTLERLMHTLSGGEAQRINLSTALGSSLIGTLYVLDEPSIGLHPRDTQRLINILKSLRNIGNTILVVEHDAEIMQQSDYIIDIGPKAGEHGGNVVFQGMYNDLIKHKTSITSKYLRGEKKVELISKVKKQNIQKFINLRNIRKNNLDIDELKIPLGQLVCVTGVSGSGKSTLINDVLYSTLNKFQNQRDGFELINNSMKKSGFDIQLDENPGINYIEMVDQSPIGRSSRSTPATYTKVFDGIRDLYASTQIAKQFGWSAGYFSFNAKGGRCDVCEGEGYITVEMQFLPDVSLVCEECNGSRYNKEVKNVLYNGKSIIDVLNMTIDEATSFFAETKKLHTKLKLLQDVGLGYLRLGQPSSNLSGGEAQRLKLSMHIDTAEKNAGLLIFDEPTTGLHFEDISKLLKCFERLVETGNSVIIIEHNINVIASADYIIDLGPEAGERGGKVVVTGLPNEVANTKESLTGKALKQFFETGL